MNWTKIILITKFTRLLDKKIQNKINNKLQQLVNDV